MALLRLQGGDYDACTFAPTSARRATPGMRRSELRRPGFRSPRLRASLAARRHAWAPIAIRERSRRLAGQFGPLAALDALSLWRKRQRSTTTQRALPMQSE